MDSSTRSPTQKSLSEFQFHPLFNLFLLAVVVLYCIICSLFPFGMSKAVVVMDGWRDI